MILDDTSYYLFFDKLTDAFFTWVFLNFPDVKEFLSSLVFINSKRPYTKEILMRLNYENLIKRTDYKSFLKFYRENLADDIGVSFSESNFNTFKDSFKKSDN